MNFIFKCVIVSGLLNLGADASGVARVQPADQALLRPDPQNWPTYSGSYDSHRYSTLREVTAANAHKKVDELLIPDIDAELLRAFLRHIEEKRKCSVSSRNQRLAAIHALAGFIAERCPEYLHWCAQLRAVKFKRSAPAPVVARPLILRIAISEAFLALNCENQPHSFGTG